MERIKSNKTVFSSQRRRRRRRRRRWSLLYQAVNCAWTDWHGFMLLFPSIFICYRMWEGSFFPWQLFERLRACRERKENYLLFSKATEGIFFEDKRLQVATSEIWNSWFYPVLDSWLSRLLDPLRINIFVLILSRSRKYE
jgi:hypothetical protein